MLEGGAAKAPADPTRDGYTFSGWDKDFSKVTSDLTVTATWTKIAAPAPAVKAPTGGTVRSDGFLVILAGTLVVAGLAIQRLRVRRSA